MKAKLTPAEAAAEERRLWMRKVRSMQRVTSGTEHRQFNEGWSWALQRLAEYGEGRTKRNKKKEGGL